MPAMVPAVLVNNPSGGGGMAAAEFRGAVLRNNRLIETDGRRYRTDRLFRPPMQGIPVKERADMPEMNLFEPDALSLGGISGIWTRLWAYMLWPDNETGRTAYVLSMHADALAAIERRANSDQDYAAAEKIAYANFRKLGGWTGLAPRWRSDMDLKRAGKPLRTAAAVLDIIRKTPTGAGSLNKTVHVIGKSGPTYNLITGRTGIINAWNTHRSVAHLGIALLVSGENVFGGSPRRLARFLAIGRDYQRFATTYPVPHHHGVLIDPAEIWSVPEGLSLPDPPGLGSLPDDMLRALSTYRAPQ